MRLCPGVPVIPVSAVGGSIALAGFIYAVMYCKKKWKENNRNNEEQEPIVRNAAGDEQPNLIYNPIEELNPANRSGPLPIGATRPKADVNFIRNVLC